MLDEAFRLSEGGGHADHLHAGGLGEEPGERIANELVILYDQDSNHGDAAALEMFVRGGGCKALRQEWFPPARQPHRQRY